MCPERKRDAFFVFVAVVTLSELEGFVVETQTLEVGPGSGITLEEK